MSRVWRGTVMDSHCKDVHAPLSPANEKAVFGDKPSKSALPRLSDLCSRVTCRALGVKDWDRHTDTMCLPSTAIVEREVRKVREIYQRKGKKKNSISKGSRQNPHKNT